MRIRGSTAALTIITQLSTVFVLKNIIDEGWQLENGWWDVLFYSSLWLIIPYILWVMGIVAKGRGKRTFCLIYSIILMGLFASYAFNGSSETRSLHGAQHMHIILVPFELLFITFIGVAVGVAISCVLLVERRRQRRREEERKKV